MEDDTVALGDSEFLKACREGPGLADDLIPGQAPVFEDQCLLVAAFGASPQLNDATANNARPAR